MVKAGSILSAAACVCSLGFGMGQKNVNTVLEEFNVAHDLSQRTIDENRGHLYEFSRKRLDQMGARTLKDIFKTLPVIYYQENRYGIPDPLNGGFVEPYRSNFIRVFIDGVEVTQGWAGSGLLMYGDMDIGFADHIECYLMAPSFEKSVEPAYLTIFVYSKEPDRDGSMVRARVGTNGYQSYLFQSGQNLNNATLLTSLSVTQNKRPRIDNQTATPLSRDQNRTQMFIHYKDDTFFSHFQWLRYRGDAFAGLSFDATPLVSKADYDQLHLDGGMKLSEYLDLQASFEWFKAAFVFTDDIPLVPFGAYVVNSVDMRFTSNALTVELDYKRQLGRHLLHTGIKMRGKHLIDVSERTIGKFRADFNREHTYSYYLQDQYEIQPGHLLSFGGEFSWIDRNGGAGDDRLWQMRLGYIATGASWSYKGYLYRAMYALDPLARFMGYTQSPRFNIQKSWALTSEIAFRTKKSKSRLFGLWMKDTEGLNNTYTVGAGNTKYRYLVFDHTYRIDLDTDIQMMLYYARYDDIFTLSKLEDTSGFFSFRQSWYRWDWYADLVWHRNTIDGKDYFDLGARASWDITPEHTVTIRGENLIDKAKASQLIRFDPLSQDPLTPLSVPHIDRRITVEWEYIF